MLTENPRWLVDYDSDDVTSRPSPAVLPPPDYVGPMRKRPRVGGVPQWPGGVGVQSRRTAVLAHLFRTHQTLGKHWVTKTVPIQDTLLRIALGTVFSRPIIMYHPDDVRTLKRVLVSRAPLQSDTPPI